MSNSAYVRRTLAIRDAQRAFRAGASLEHVLGLAYNAGHIDGSEVATLTSIDLELVAAVAQLSTSELDEIEDLAPEVVGRERERRLGEINAEAEAN